jgi:hypothetical protein
VKAFKSSVVREQACQVLEKMKIEIKKNKLGIKFSGVVQVSSCSTGAYLIYVIYA